MTEKQTSSSRNKGSEFLLSELTDETPPSSSDESVGNQNDQPVFQNEKNQQNLSAKTSTHAENESMCKLEKEALNKILAIKSEVEKIKQIILSAEKEDVEKDFKAYEEILVSKTLGLDNIQTNGVEKIKKARKETIVFVQECLNLLDLTRK